MIESLTGQGINVQQACVVLAVSQSGYYAWRGRVDAPRTLRRIWLAGEIADVHKASGGTYGALRVTAELRYGRDIQVGHNAVELIMRELGIKGLPTRRLPRGAKVSKVTSLDLVGRVFRRDRPNELWLTDITEHPTREGKVYCAVVLDAFSRLVVGWSIDSTQPTTLVLNALGMATQRRKDRDGLVIHSDRGVQFEPGRVWRSLRAQVLSCGKETLRRCHEESGIHRSCWIAVFGWRLRAAGRLRMSLLIWGSTRRRCASGCARPRSIRVAVRV